MSDTAPTTVGKNTLAGAELQSYVDRLERIDLQKKALSDDRKAVVAEAKARGFSGPGINYIIKVRRLKPHDRQEAEAIRDLYMHAMGMDNEPPLFRQIEALARDCAGGEKLLEAFQLLVPASGEIILNLDGKRIRVWRDKDGIPQSADYTEVAPAAQTHTRSTLPVAAKKEVPNCTESEAEALGHQAGKDNRAVIDNPFPFDDARRPRWDLGWRKATGNDGMGPN